MIKFSELNTAKSCEGLVPAIIQDDDTRQVLMLGYLNEEAFDKTVAEGRVTFFSRTKGRLWTKGETSATIACQEHRKGLQCGYATNPRRSGRPGLPHGKQDLLRRPRERGPSSGCCSR